MGRKAENGNWLKHSEAETCLYLFSAQHRRACPIPKRKMGTGSSAAKRRRACTLFPRNTDVSAPVPKRITENSPCFFASRQFDTSMNQYISRNKAGTYGQRESLRMPNSISASAATTPSIFATVRALQWVSFNSSTSA